MRIGRRRSPRSPGSSRSSSLRNSSHCLPRTQYATRKSSFASRPASSGSARWPQAACNPDGNSQSSAYLGDAEKGRKPLAHFDALAASHGVLQVIDVAGDKDQAHHQAQQEQTQIGEPRHPRRFTPHGNPPYADSMSDARFGFATVEGAVEEIRQGRKIVLVDDEDRENEGDLTMAAEKITPEAINFMAKFGRGLICLALTEQR